MEAWNKIKFSDYDIQSIIKRYKENVFYKEEN